MSRINLEYFQKINARILLGTDSDLTVSSAWGVLKFPEGILRFSHWSTSPLSPHPLPAVLTRLSVAVAMGRQQ